MKTDPVKRLAAMVMALAILPALAIVDGEMDQMSDLWEKAHQFSTSDDGSQIPSQHPQADPDGDGWSNLMESRAGTDPWSGMPPEGFLQPRVIHQASLPGVFAISWPTKPGKQYRLLVSPDLSAASWTQVGEPMLCDGTPVEMAIQSDPQAAPYLFWRVEVEDVDSDGDGVSNYEAGLLSGVPNLGDIDGDELDDWWEIYYFGDIISQDGNGDPDNDLASNILEFKHGSNPLVVDTDGDGFADGAEIDASTDPTDPLSSFLNLSAYMGLPINDANVPYIGNLGYGFLQKGERYRLYGAIGSGFHDKERIHMGYRWQASFNGRTVTHRDANIPYPTVFDHYYSGNEIVRVTISPFDPRMLDATIFEEWGEDPFASWGGQLFDHSGFIECADGGSLFNRGLTWYPANWSSAVQYFVPIKPTGGSASYYGHDAVGPRYRKIALNGRPISDVKPEQEPEEGSAVNEETFIDAFTLNLHHDTSYLHIPLPGSDLALQVNASVRDTTWSNTRGLQTHEELTAPFGACWSTNLCAYVEVIETLGENSVDPVTVNVVDENGSPQRFGTKSTDLSQGPQTFFPWPSSRVDKKTYLNELKRVGNDLVLQKKFGNKLIYKPCNAWFLYGGDRRTVNSNTAKKHTYWRLDSVEDRFGQRLLYDYGTSLVSLIPQKISAEGRPGQHIVIQRSTDGRRVTSVTDPLSKTTRFTYAVSPVTAAASSSYYINFPEVTHNYLTLTKVWYVDSNQQTRTIADYTYNAVPEEDFVGNDRTVYFHANLASIKDATGNEYSFEYDFDDKQFAFSSSSSAYQFAVPDVSVNALPGNFSAIAWAKLNALNASLSPGNSAAYRQQRGLPRLVKKVTLPAPQPGESRKWATFQKTANSKLEFGPNKFAAIAGTEVTDAEGSKVRYTFGGVQGQIIDTSVRTIGSGSNTSLSKEWMVYYTSMDIDYLGGGSSSKGSEKFEFNPAAGLSLSKAVDFCGNVTTWKYDDPLVVTQVPWSAPGVTFMTAWSDPTSKTDALGRNETYTYGNLRIMSSVTDVHGTKTEYNVDTLGRRRSMTVTDKDNNKLQEERYDFDHAALPGFMTRRTRKAFTNFSESAWERDLVTEYVPDESGRGCLWKEIVDPGGKNLTTTHTYDLNNNKKSTSDPKTQLTYFEYDDRYRLTKVIYPDTSFKRIVYDINGRKAIETDENGNATYYGRDGFGRVAAVLRDMDKNGVDAGDLITGTDYDAVGNVTRSVDPRGFATVTFFDDLHRPQYVFKGVPEATAYHLGTLQSLAESNRSVTREDLFYDKTANCGGGLLNAWKPTKTIRHKAVSSDRDASDVSLTNLATYDKVYRPLTTSVEYAPGAANVTTMAYGAIANGKEALVSTVTDARNKSTRTLLDGLGRAYKVTEALGSPLERSVQTFHTSTGLPWRVIDVSGRHTETEYDAAGRAVKVFSPDPVTGLRSSNSPVVETIYDANSNVEAVIDPRLNRTDFHYDLRNRKWKTEAPAVTNAANPDSPVANVRPTIITGYDNVGNVIAVTDARGNITRTFHDAANRAYATRSNAVTGNPSNDPKAPGANDLTTTNTLDAGGLVLAVQDANGNFTRNSYDSLGRLTSTATDPATGDPATESTTKIVVTHLYDDSGNLIEVTDGKGQKTAFTYDGLARKTRTIWDPGTAAQRVETSVFDALVQIQRIDARGWVTEFAYDALHRVSATACAQYPADNRHISYTLSDKLESITYPNDAVNGALRAVSYGYDKLDHVTSEVSAGLTHGYFYDKANNREKVIYGRTGRALVSTYDSNNRLETCTEKDSDGASSGRVTTYSYDLGGKVTRKKLPNNAATTTAFDFLGRTLTMTERNGSGGVISAFSYAYAVGGWPSSYDGVGNVLQVQEIYSQAGMVNRVVENAYDKTYRLSTETITPTGQSASVTSYGYDLANNRTVKTVNGASTVYQFGDGTNGFNSNQLMSYGPQGQAATDTFTYDLNGNRKTHVKSGTNGFTDTLTWDRENHMTGLSRLGSSSLASYVYSYDYRARRVLRDESAANGIKTALSFSGGTSVLEWNTTTDVLETEHIRGSDWGGGVGGVLYSIRGGARSFAAYNSRGDVVSRSDDSGAATWQGAYEAFGTRTLEQGSNQERQRANTKDEDPTGLLNEKHRYRDLEAGVFISRDPAGFVDGPNVYTYVRQNPWSAFDPEGLATMVNDGEITSSNYEQVNLPEAKPPLSERDQDIQKWGAKAVEGYETNSARAQFRKSAMGALTRYDLNDPLNESGQREALWGELFDQARSMGDDVAVNDLVANRRGFESGQNAARYAGAGLMIGQMAIEFFIPGPFDEAASVATMSTRLPNIARAPLALTYDASTVTYQAGKIRSFVTQADEIYYRVYSGNNTAGSFLSQMRPKSADWAVEAFALPPGNRADFIQEVLVPAGTRLQRSRAALNRWGRGGAEQFEILKLFPDQYQPVHFGPGTPFR